LFRIRFLFGRRELLFLPFSLGIIYLANISDLVVISWLGPLVWRGGIVSSWVLVDVVSVGSCANIVSTISGPKVAYK
jgi:hypothetical protein